VGKYDPLREHLAALPENVRELTMHFGEIQQLVGRLPRSAYVHRAWWANTDDARVEAQAWRGAGWHVRMVSLATETVVFARGGSAAGARQDSLLEATGASAGGDSARDSEAKAVANGPGDGMCETGTALRKPAPWRAMRGDLLAGLIAATAAGTTALVALTHLPWLAIVFLSLVVGAIAFTIMQAIASHDNLAKAVRWWALSTIFTLLGCAGAFAYHKFFDPATREPLVPFTATVKLDPSPQVIDQGCRTIVLPGPWHRVPVPSEPLTATGVNTWEASRRGVDGTSTTIVVELQGRSNQVVTIDQPLVVITSRHAPIQGTAVELSGGCGSTLQHRVFAVDLDQRNPVVAPIAGITFPGLGVKNAMLKQASAPSFTISASNPEYFVIVATAKRSFCQWYLEISWESMGKTGMLSIRKGAAPLR
jgi:hypothetical protein